MLFYSKGMNDITPYTYRKRNEIMILFIFKYISHSALCC